MTPPKEVATVNLVALCEFQRVLNLYRVLDLIRRSVVFRVE